MSIQIDSLIHIKLKEGKIMAPTSKLNANGVEIGVIGETMGENAYFIFL